MKIGLSWMQAMMGSLVFAATVASGRGATTVEPPPMPRREIAPGQPPPGIVVELTNRDVRATLFLPEGWRIPSDGGVRLVVHFHTVAWFTIQEHARRGSKLPLLNFALGEGSATYAKSFQDPSRFSEWLHRVESELKNRGAAAQPRVRWVDISSFSAGYGAVREILKLDSNLGLIQRMVLCDSLYGGLVDTNAPYGRRAVVPEHVESWLPFARAAARGDKTFLLTTSEIQTIRYASTTECGQAVANAVGARFVPVENAAIAATRETEFPLIRRADLGRFHIWNYAGTNAQAHLTHVRHLADLWRALDADGD